MFQIKFSFKLNFKTKVWDWEFCNREIPPGLQDRVEDMRFSTVMPILQELFVQCRVCRSTVLSNLSKWKTRLHTRARLMALFPRLCG